MHNPMTRFPRKSDGRRIYTPEFKREPIGAVLRGELTIAETSRKLGIARGLLQRWKRLAIEGTVVAKNTGGGRKSATGAGSADQTIADLHRLVGRQTAELFACRAELDALKKRRGS